MVIWSLPTLVFTISCSSTLRCCPLVVHPQDKDLPFSISFKTTSLSLPQEHWHFTSLCESFIIKVSAIIFHFTLTGKTILVGVENVSIEFSEVSITGLISGVTSFLVLALL